MQLLKKIPIVNRLAISVRGDEEDSASIAEIFLAKSEWNN
jgi:hypothetical protein